jgi:nitroimidazol reductase NimA-like FMN-containing flavoprotein (pyridoxamine 5'-phosphate oxidase superfamily)
MTISLSAEMTSILQSAREMTVAAVRPDGYPQATTVNYVNDGHTIYFACDLASQKARNIAQNNKVSVTITLPYVSWADIRAVSIGGTAKRVRDRSEQEKVRALVLKRFPEGVGTAGPDMEQLARALPDHPESRLGTQLHARFWQSGTPDVLKHIAVLGRLFVAWTN